MKKLRGELNTPREIYIEEEDIMVTLWIMCNHAFSFNPKEPILDISWVNLVYVVSTKFTYSYNIPIKHIGD